MAKVIFKQYPIKDVGIVVTGSTPTTSDASTWIGEIPFLTPTDIDGFDYVLNVERRVSGSEKKGYSSRIIQAKSVGVVCIGATIGKLARINEPTLTNQQINTIIPNPTLLDRDYLFYLLSLYESYLKKLAGGSATPLLVKSDFENILLSLPSLERQEIVGNILSNFDELIFQYSQVVKNLKDLSAKIFEYWFVQYDFQDSNNKPYKASGGKMVLHQELRISAPQNWEVCKLDKFIKVLSGYAFNSDEYSNNGQFGVVTIRNVKDGILDLTNQNRINIDLDSIPSHCLLKEKDILISLTGNVGRVAFVHEGNQLLNQRVGKLDPQSEFRNFGYLYLSRPETKKRLTNIANGSSQDNLSPKEVFADLISVPPNEVLKKFNEILDPIFDQIIKVQKQINLLSVLKDYYLPLLITGKLDWKFGFK